MKAFPSCRLFSTAARPLIAAATVFLVSAAEAQPAAGGGTIAGTVSNAATKDFLQDAVVTIPALGRHTLTDSAGRFTLGNLPPGSHTVVVAYLGLDDLRHTVEVQTGERRDVRLEMTSDFYTMSEVVVTGEREGNAAAITRQRAAVNLKNVVAMDALGNLPNDNVGELLQRMPGVIGWTNTEGDVTNVRVRGLNPELINVSVDGNLMASNAGFGREFRMQAISGSLFSELEVTKAPTPEMSADSIGGVVNMKTRSGFEMTEKRRVGYKAMARWAPPFYTHIPMKRGHRIHPLLHLNYQEQFSLPGGERNLAVSLNAFYSENVNGKYMLRNDYERTTESPAYMNEIRAQEEFNNRKQQGLSLRLDYRLTPRTELYLSGLWNVDTQSTNPIFEWTASTNRNVATIGPNGQPTGNGGILPGYTDQRTQVRAVSASSLTLDSTYNGWKSYQGMVRAGAKHAFERIAVDYEGFYNQAHPNLTSGDHGNFSLSIASVGWLVDTSRSQRVPMFAQTEGRSIYDATNYTPGNFTQRNATRDTTIHGANANVRVTLPFAIDTTLKAGGAFRSQEVELTNANRRWSYIGADPLPVFVDPTFSTRMGEQAGRELPFASPPLVSRHFAANPGAWREDLYYAATQPLTGAQRVTEDVTSGYVQAQARIGKLTLLGGVRTERTEVEGRGNIASRLLSTNAQRNADPVGAARADYDNPRRLTGSYDDFFPGVHAVYRFTPGLQGRLSWSNSIGRAGMTNFLPMETANVQQQRLNVNNAALKPQYSENWDASVEYYFEPVGQISFGVFRKDLTDFLVSGEVGIIGSGPNNGFNGEYAGYTLFSSYNGGAAKIEGYEVNYEQALSFLPGPLRGFRVMANYTRLWTRGNYGGTDTVTAGELQDFVPEAWNAGLEYRHRGLGGRVLVNYFSDFVANFNANPPQMLYARHRTTVNAGVSYRLRNGVEFSLDVQNATNAPLVQYRYIEARQQRFIQNGTHLVCGVSQKF